MENNFNNQTQSRAIIPGASSPSAPVFSTRRERCKIALTEWCAERSADINVILSKSRKPAKVALRHRAWNYLRSLGYSYCVIAWVCNRDHSSIVYACNKNILGNLLDSKGAE